MKLSFPPAPVLVLQMKIFQIVHRRQRESGLRARRHRTARLAWTRERVTIGLPLRGLSFVLPVCRRRIISLETVIPDTLKWSATAW
jgi:hypothetical protein